MLFRSDGVGYTASNLKAALDGETYEFSTMYPGFIEDAKAESHTAAKRSFHLANEAEKVHGGLYKKALEGLAALKGKDADWYLNRNSRYRQLRRARIANCPPQEDSRNPRQHCGQRSTRGAYQVC